VKPFDATGMFRSTGDVGGGELRRLAVRGAGATVFSQGVSFAVQMTATVVLARLLTPADFGVVTMVTTFSLLVMNFGLNGFTEAVVQREKIDEALVSNLFWINAGAGLLLTLGFAAAGSLLAQFYHDQRVADVAVGISPTIFLTSLSVQHLALLKRAMRFSAVSANDVVARAMSVATSVLLALAGWGYWALVAGAIAAPLSTTIGAWLVCRWRPTLPRHTDDTRSMVWFALHVYGRFSFSYLCWNTDNVLIGWRFHARSLGFYKKAFDLFHLPADLLAPLNSVAVSALSRLNRDPAQYRRYFLAAVAVVAFVGMGLAGDLTLVGRDVIRLLLGPGWEPAGQIFTFFAPGIGVMLLLGTTGWIHLSIGRPDRWIRWGVVEFAVTVLLFLLGLQWGPAGVAMAWTVSYWILTMPAFWYAGRPIDLGVAPVFSIVWKYVLASALAGYGSVILRGIPPFSAASNSLGSFANIVVVSALFGTLYLGAVILLHRGSAPLTLVADVLREMIPRRGLSTSSPAAATSAAGSCEVAQPT
jgi:polysaccharide transporter, PST family